MRFIFSSLLLILTISVLALVAVDTITGKITNTPNCPGAHTYAFYRTLAEKTAVENMWQQAGFKVVADEPAPESFRSSGYEGFLCIKRMTHEEMGQIQHRERPRVVTKGFHDMMPEELPEEYRN